MGVNVNAKAGMEGLDGEVRTLLPCWLLIVKDVGTCFRGSYLNVRTSEGS